MLLSLAWAGRGDAQQPKTPPFQATWSPDGMGTCAATVPTFDDVHLFYKSFTPTPAELVDCFWHKFHLSVFSEHGRSTIPQLKRGLLAEDLGGYYLHMQVSHRKNRRQRASSLHAADVVVVNSLPRLSKVVGQCKGTTHTSRQAEVFLWVKTNKEQLKLKPTVFPCTSYTCRFDLAVQHSMILAEINTTVLINELNGGWMPATNSWQTIREFPRLGRETNAARKHYGVPVPYSAHHSIPRPALAVEKTKQFVYIGSLRNDST